VLGYAALSGRFVKGNMIVNSATFYEPATIKPPQVKPEANAGCNKILLTMKKW
jgi:hypothetical protein